MFKAIIWDNDGVLVNTENLYLQATRQVLQKYDINLTLELYRELFLKKSGGAWHLAREMGAGDEDIESMREIRNKLYLSLIRENNVGIPGVRQVLKFLRPYYIMAIVTSSRKEHFELIHTKTDFTQFFKFILTREDYSNAKPDPEPYIKALEMLGMEPAEVLVIEDSERGLTAAKKAGLSCWVIPNNLSCKGDFSLADQILPDVNALQDLLPE